MKNSRTTKPRKPSAGRRIIASLKEAVDWAEGKDVPVRVTTVEVPAIDVRAMRRRLGLSQESFAAKFGFQGVELRGLRGELPGLEGLQAPGVSAVAPVDLLLSF